MKRGTQAKLLRYLTSEYGRKPSKQAVSDLFTDKDYRVILLKNGELDIPKTAKLLDETDFGRHGQKIKRKMDAKKGKPVVKENLTTEQSGNPGELEDDEEIDFSKPLSIEDSRELIEKHKAFHQSEKIRIENDLKQANLLTTVDAVDSIYSVFKDISEMTQALVDKLIIPIRAAKTEHDATVIMKDNVHNVLSILADPGLPKDDVKKKIYGRIKRQLKKR